MRLVVNNPYLWLIWTITECSIMIVLSTLTKNGQLNLVLVLESKGPFYIEVCDWLI